MGKELSATGLTDETGGRGRDGGGGGEMEMRIEEGQTVVGDLYDKWRPQVFNEFDKLKTAGLQMAWFWTKMSHR